MDTAEYMTLKECYPGLITCIKQSPDDVFDNLMPTSLLAPGDLAFLRNPQNNKDDKARRIVDVVLNQVQSNSGAYSIFLSALKAAGPWTEAAVSVLEQKYKSRSTSQLQSPTPECHQPQVSAYSRSPLNDSSCQQTGAAGKLILLQFYYRIGFLITNPDISLKQNSLILHLQRKFVLSCKRVIVKEKV